MSEGVKIMHWNNVSSPYPGSEPLAYQEGSDPLFVLDNDREPTSESSGFLLAFAITFLVGAGLAFWAWSGS